MLHELCLHLAQLPALLLQGAGVAATQMRQQLVVARCLLLLRVLRLFA